VLNIPYFSNTVVSYSVLQNPPKQYYLQPVTLTTWHWLCPVLDSWQQDKTRLLSARSAKGDYVLHYCLVVFVTRISIQHFSCN